MISGHENIAKLFSVFHDGGIADHLTKEKDLILTVEILYLAQRIHPSFKKFYLTLKQPQKIQFIPWRIDLAQKPVPILELKKIFEPDLDILEGQLQDDLVQVVCNQLSAGYDYCGGVLSFKTEGVDVQDEAGKRYSLEELTRLSEAYWKDWEKRDNSALMTEK